MNDRKRAYPRGGIGRRLLQAAIAAARRLHLRRTILPAASRRYRRERTLEAQLQDKIEQPGFEKLCRACEEAPERARDSFKYLRLSESVEDAVRNAGLLGLLHAAPLRVLDLGCGAGLFLYTLRHRGHEVPGMDLDDDPIYHRMIELLCVPTRSTQYQAV